MRRLFLGACLLLGAAAPALAQPAPPAEAVAACAGKAVGRQPSAALKRPRERTKPG